MPESNDFSSSHMDLFLRCRLLVVKIHVGRVFAEGRDTRNNIFASYGFTSLYSYVIAETLRYSIYSLFIHLLESKIYGLCYPIATRMAEKSFIVVSLLSVNTNPIWILIDA